MRVLEIGYATIRNWLCDYSKLAMRLFETKKGMYSHRKSTSPIYRYDKNLSARVLWISKNHTRLNLDILANMVKLANLVDAHATLPWDDRESLALSNLVIKLFLWNDFWLCCRRIAFANNLLTCITAITNLATKLVGSYWFTIMSARVIYIIIA